MPRKGESDSFSQLFLVASLEKEILVMDKACGLIMQVSQIK